MERKIKIVSFVLLFITCMFVCINSFQPLAFADEEISKEEVDTRSIQRDYLMPFFTKKITDSSSIFDISGEQTSKRQSDNQRIAIGNQIEKLSLYDRFGSGISYSIYLGETSIKTNFTDKIYTAARENEFSFSTVMDVLTKEDATYNNVFYDKRPEIKTADSDPRAARYKKAGGFPIIENVSLSVANYFNETAKVIVNITTLFISDQFITNITNVFKIPFEDSKWNNVKNIFDVLLAIMGLTIAIYIVRMMFKVIKGKESFKKVFTNLLGSMISLGLVLSIIASPLTFINISEKLMTIGESLTASAINEQYKDDEIINSSKTDNVIAAAIWEDAIFKPWVKGMFGGTAYEDLYTTYSTTGNKWQLTNTAASNIGDIGVQRDSNRENDVKNWAALAYSCSTVYHINAIESEKIDYVPSVNEKLLAQEEKVWPKATLAGSGNDAIYKDDFRWVDASMKVGQYLDETNNSTFDSYSGYREYDFQGIFYSGRSVWLAVLLIPIMILAFKKISSVVALLAGGVRLLFRSCVNVYSPDRGEYNLLKNVGVTFFEPLKKYMLELILIMVGIQLYKTLGVSDNFGFQIVYLVILYYLCTLKPATVSKHFETIKRSSKNFVHKAKGNILKGQSNFLKEKIDNMPDSSEDIIKRMKHRERAEEVEKIKEQTDKMKGIKKDYETEANGVTIEQLLDINDELQKKCEYGNKAIQQFDAAVNDLKICDPKERPAKINELLKQAEEGEINGTRKERKEVKKLLENKNCLHKKANKNVFEHNFTNDERQDALRRKEEKDNMKYESFGKGNQNFVLLSKELKNLKYKDDLSQGDIDKASSKIKKSTKRRKEEALEKGLKDFISGGNATKSFIPPHIKFYILLGLLALYVAGLIIAIIFGI